MDHFALFALFRWRNVGLQTNLKLKKSQFEQKLRRKQKYISNPDVACAHIKAIWLCVCVQ